MPQMAAAFVFKFVATNLVRLGVSKVFAVAIANVAGYVVSSALVIGASAIVNAVFAPRQSMPDGRIPLRQSAPTRKSAFGRIRGSGAYLNYAVDGGDSIDVLAIHDGRIAGIDAYLLHDDYVTLETGRLGAGHVVGNASTHQYYEAIYFDTRLGTANQTAFQRSAGRLSSSVWSSSHLMAGVAGLELLCLGPKQERLPKVYPLGLPRPSVVYRAQYCFDPRDEAQDVDDWTTWTPGSRNPILQLITHLINPRDPDPAEPDRCLGEGQSFAEIIEPQLAAWVQAADDCDAQIAKKGGGTEPAYQCDFEYFVGEDPADTRARILASCDGWMAEAGDGALTVAVGKYRAPAVTLSNDWLVDYEVVAGVEQEKRKNVLIGFWTDPDQKFTRIEGERWYDAAHIALVGKAEFQPAEFTQVQSHGQLRRLLKRLMAKMAAPRRGVLRCDLRALDVVGQRWIALPSDFPIAALQGAVIEVDDLNIDLGADRIEIPFIQADPDIDDWDPDSEEGTAPPSPSEVAVQPVPVIDTGDIGITIATEPVFGGGRAAVATLVFDAPVNTFDLGAGGMVDEPRVELGWLVRWRPSGGGEWVEEPYSGDVVSGNQEDGYIVTLKTPGLPREEIHVQLAAIGGNGGRGAFSDSMTVDVAAATAPALSAATGVTAVASMEEGDTGARRPILTVGFDAITDPQAQLVIIAVKPVGASDSSYSQIDAVEPRLGGKVVWNVPLGETVDVGVQVWAQWREPSAWTTVSSVEISGELSAGRATGSVTQDDIDAALAFLASANPELAAGLATLTQVGAINRIFDPLFQLGVRDNVSESAPLSLIQGDPNALAAELNVGTGDTLDIVFKPRFELRPQSRLMIGAEMTLSGPLSEATLQVRFFDADGVEVGSPVEVASATTGSRAADFLESADIPDGVRWGQFEAVATSTAAGTARLQVHEPFVAYAGPNQATVEAFRDPQDEAVGRIIAKSLVDQARVFEIEGLVHETAVSRAAVLVLQEVTANVARYQTSVTYEGADGVTYALSELYAADGVSRILNIAGVLAFANPDAGGDGVTVAMEIRDAVVHILKELRLDDDAAFTYYDTGSPDVLRICIGKHPVSGDVGVFLYDENGDPLLAFNVTDNTATLYPAMAAEGFAGVNAVGGAEDFDWTTDSSPRVPADFEELEFETNTFTAIPGGKIIIQGLYKLQAQLNTVGWFRFEHKVELMELNAGVYFARKAFNWRPHACGWRTNTGAPTGLASTDTVDHDINIFEWHTWSVGNPKVSSKVRVTIRAKAFASGDAVNDSPDDTKLQDTLKIPVAIVNAHAPRPGVYE